MINLYIFNESSRAAVYGIGTYIRELIIALKDSDIQINIIHLHSEKPVVELTEVDGVCHLHIPSPKNSNLSIIRKRQNDLYYRTVVYLLRLKIKNSGKLIFHLNFNISGKLADGLKKAFDCKIIAAMHCLEWCLILNGNVTQFRKIISNQVNENNDESINFVNELYLKEKNCFSLVDHIICLSENTQQILLDDYHIESNKLHVIYNGLSDCYAATAKNILRKKNHIQPDMYNIIFAGRLDDIKGLRYLLRAYQLVLKKQPLCHLIIVGNGSFDIYMKECEDIWMHVTWTGLISKDKLYELYSIADIGVMPSFHEQCSYVAIEMMMHGVPLIASTSTGLKEMVEDRVTGLHIPVIEHPDRVEIDSTLLAEKMLYLLEHSKARNRIGANARKRYETVYSAEIFRQNMLDYYRSLFHSTKQ